MLLYRKALSGPLGGVLNPNQRRNRPQMAPKMLIFRVFFF